MSSPSDAPVRAAGIHTRSGNAMLRTRAAILDAASTCVELRGVRKTTMSDVSSTGRVAKATLYNHFRTKDDLLDALVLSRIEALGAQCAEVAGKGLAGALELAAAVLAASEPLRRVAQDEPAVLAALAVPGDGRLWDAARTAVVSVLRAADAPSDRPAADLVLRWVLAQAAWPGSREEVSLGAQILEDGLGQAPADEEPAEGFEPLRGLGWPG